MTAQFDSARFREVLGYLPTGVVVVTGVDASGEPSGITIGSFVSVSLEPPLVGFFPGLRSRSWPAIAEGKKFCANILSSAQADECWRFAKEPQDDTANRFDGLHWTSSPSGMPVLPNAIGWIDCSIESVTEAGDHWFVLGRVETLHIAETTDEAMVFYKSKVAGIDTDK
jgi:flavin reductase (DIM6/NTAB) family NADH-FMN oxidoreductase RutF